MKIIAAAMILGAALVAAAFVAGGRYQTVAVSGGTRFGYSITTDRYTGAKVLCYAARCRPAADPDLDANQVFNEIDRQLGITNENSN